MWRAHKRDEVILDPRTCLLLSFIVSTASLTGDIEGNSVYFRLILILVPVCLLFWIRKWAMGSLFFVILFVSWLYETKIGLIPSHALTLLGYIASNIVTRFLPSILMGYFIINTLTVDKFIRGLDLLKLPRGLIISIAIMFRFIPTLIEERRYIQKANKMKANFSDSYVTTFPIISQLVPMIHSAIRISNDLTMSVLTRGLDINEPRTSIIDLKLKFKDYTILVISMILMYFNLTM
ncbi:energy-coupling factor transporter transmembrane component T [Staphylococcus simulans]